MTLCAPHSLRTRKTTPQSYSAPRTPTATQLTYSEDLNLLVLGVVLSDVVLPLTWKVLPHDGNRDMRAWMLVGLRLQRLPARRWAVLIAETGG